MADGIVLNSGSGGATLATDDVSGTHYPVGKVAFGALDSATLVTATSGFPVQPQTSSVWDFNLKQYNGSAVAATNPVFVRLSDGSAAVATLPVSVASVPSHDVTNAGTFAVQAAQSGTWNITNVSGTVSLPTGAATAAKQPALGTAGSASADVLTVQGIASMTALKVDGSAVTQPVSGSVSVSGSATVTGNKSEDAAAADGDAGLPILGVRNDAAAARTSTDGDYGMVALDAAGRVGIADLGGSVSVDDNGGSLTVDGTVAATQSGTWTVTGAGGTFPVTDSSGSLTVDAPVGTPVFVRLSDGSSAISTLPVSLASVPSHAVTNAGAFAVQESGAALTALQVIDNPVVVDDTAFTPASTSVMMAGFTFDDVAPDSVNEGDAGAARMSANRNIYVQVRDAAGNERGLNIDASGNLTANITGTVTVGAHAVTNAGTFAVQESGAALTSLQLLDDTVFAEDAGHTTGDKGVQLLAVRNDSDASLCGTSLDYTPLQVDANGYLKVNIKAGAGSGGTAMTDDAAYTAAATSFTPVGGIVTSDSVDAGDGGAFAMLANRQQKVTLYDSAGVELAVGGGTQYSEDAAHTTGDKVTGCGIVRKDTAASLAGTDGDYTLPIADANGKLWVNASGVTLTVDGSGVTQPVSGTVAVSALTPGTGATSLGKAEDAAHASGDVGVMALAVRSDTAASTSGTTGDYQPLITNATGHLWVDASGQTLTVASHNVTNAGTFAVQAAQSGTWTVTGSGGTFPVTDSGGSLTVDNGGTFATQPAGSAAHDGVGTGVNPVLVGAYASAAAPTDVSADGDAVRLWALRSGAVVNQQSFAGTLASAGNGASGAGVQRVTIANDSTGVLATVSTVTTLANGQTAHDGASTGSPLRIGAKAETSITGVTLVADGDATDLYAGVDGVLIVRPHCNLEDVVQERATNTDGASTAFASGLAAPGAGIRLWIKNVTICNSSASFCTVDLRDGSAGSVLWTCPVPANGGYTMNFDPPLKLTANTALAFDASAATTTLTISANGFKSKV